MDAKILELGFVKYLDHMCETSYKKEAVNNGLTHIVIVTAPNAAKKKYKLSIHLKGGNSSLIKMDCTPTVIKRILKLLF